MEPPTLVHCQELSPVSLDATATPCRYQERNRGRCTNSPGQSTGLHLHSRIENDLAMGRSPLPNFPVHIITSPASCPGLDMQAPSIAYPAPPRICQSQPALHQHGKHRAPLPDPHRTAPSPNQSCSTKSCRHQKQESEEQAFFRQEK